MKFGIVCAFLLASPGLMAHASQGEVRSNETLLIDLEPGDTLEVAETFTAGVRAHCETPVFGANLCSFFLPRSSAVTFQAGETYAVRGWTRLYSNIQALEIELRSTDPADKLTAIRVSAGIFGGYRGIRVGDLRRALGWKVWIRARR